MLFVLIVILPSASVGGEEHQLRRKRREDQPGAGQAVCKCSGDISLRYAALRYVRYDGWGLGFFTEMREDPSGTDTLVEY
jgi:hypothetical protein